MPKKFQGENSKAATARARKAEAKAVADARRKKEEDDALWQETDKHVLKKEQRKDDKEKRRLDLLERKKENQRLLDEENARLKGKSQKEAQSGGKVTRAQIEETLQQEQQQQQQQQQQLKPKEKSHLDTPLEENVNRIIPEEGTEEARTIEDAIAVLSTGPEELDRHPERRMKAAFASYEEANMPRLKKENPNMRLSQLKQQLKKEWMKAPENPLNQRFATFNSK
ncbi:coiled-coil domain-containing protein 124 [Thunnus albacares]|uniref:coiled-coil domain-containing protein 124 n=1 Tax=Thunnus maccoyii TaxID=8240 RepID=UPI001C4C678E|nr:coiled-coil domain-containing protein 124 [Thunnus maccoyii]XP_044216723.1 coiled-coil domain-containing protein 124 [Thunnus albacares]